MNKKRITFSTLFGCHPQKYIQYLWGWNPLLPTWKSTNSLYCSLNDGNRVSPTTKSAIVTVIQWYYYGDLRNNLMILTTRSPWKNQDRRPTLNPVPRYRVPCTGSDPLRALSAARHSNRDTAEKWYLFIDTATLDAILILKVVFLASYSNLRRWVKRQYEQDTGYESSAYS